MGLLSGDGSAKPSRPPRQHRASGRAVNHGAALTRQHFPEQQSRVAEFLRADYLNCARSGDLPGKARAKLRTPRGNCPREPRAAGRILNLHALFCQASGGLPRGQAPEAPGAEHPTIPSDEARNTGVIPAERKFSKLSAEAASAAAYILHLGARQPSRARIRFIAVRPVVNSSSTSITCAARRKASSSRTQR